VDKPLLYRVDEACLLVGLSRTKLYDEIARGRLGVVHFGKSMRIPADELHAYVERAKAAAGLLQPVA
jgi:excisionase family DNA binding protein